MSFSQRKTALLSVGLATLGLCFSGCGGLGFPDTVPVSGVVLYNGEPLEDASISFISTEGRPSSGTTNVEGQFTLTTFEENDGAIPGQHQVIVQKYEPASPTDPYAKRKSLIPERYAELRTTPLQQTIKPGDNSAITVELSD